jgi:GMP reductase
MSTTGVFPIAHVLARSKLLTAIHKHYTVEEWVSFAEECKRDKLDTLSYVCLSAGSSEAELAKVKEIIAKIPEIRFICLDVANGYQEAFVQCVRSYRRAFPSHVIIAGNVVTAEMVNVLASKDIGADIIKMGIGPGSVCTTRRETGVGYPQLSACMEGMEAAQHMAAATDGVRPMIIADGGITVSGDACKALAVADFAMLGGMLAGHDESGGDLVEVEQADGSVHKFKTFFGMSSAEAMDKFNGGLKKASYRAAEGKSVRVPYRGPVEGTVLHLLGGLRSAHTYVGAATMEEYADRVCFVRVTMQTNDHFGVVRG